MKNTYNNTYIILLSFVAALGGLLFGFDISVISGTIPFLEKEFELDEVALGWAVSSGIIGCIPGALLAGRPSDVFGRKKVLIASAVLFAISAIGSGIAASLTEFFIYRFVGGIAVGMASILSPLYIAEIAPAPLRGRLVSINQLTIVIGILLAYFNNYLLLDLGEDSWRWMLASETLPAILFFVFLFFVPESPRWLIKKGEDEKALEILSKIGSSAYGKIELSIIKSSLVNETKSKVKDLFRPKIRIVLLIGILLAVFQQFSGINVIFFYAPKIFEQTGDALDSALLQTILIGVVNLSFTFVAIWFIDRIGRKKLLLAGSLGMTLCYILLGYFFYTDQLNGIHVLVVILACIAFYASSLAPVTWVLISEIFPNKIRGMAMAVATFFLWVASFVLTLTFPIMMEVFEGAFTFWIYAGVCALSFLFVLKLVPETKNKSLEEIEKELTGETFNNKVPVVGRARSQELRANTQDYKL